MDQGLRNAILLKAAEYNISKGLHPGSVVENAFLIVDAFVKEDDRRTAVSAIKICDTTAVRLGEQAEKREFRSVLPFVQMLIPVMQQSTSETLRMAALALQEWGHGKTPATIGPEELKQLIFVFEMTKKSLELDLEKVS